MDSKRKLLTPEREEIILARLGEEAKTITELSLTLGVSEATVRRDLLSLEEQGKVKRVHGGAVRVKFSEHEPVFKEKESIKPEEKERIAKLALDLINDKDTIFLDGGSTVLALAKMLGAKKGLTVVTNSLMAAAELMESGHDLIIVGGKFRPLSRTLVGPLTSKIIETLHVDKAFLGTIGFTIEDGISTTDADEAFTKELILKRAGKAILLADSSKLGKKSFAVSGALSDIDVVITDSGVPSAIARDLRKNGIDLLV
ncbi:MAG TPA: DeoR family transcriptional regulator [Lentisphaeria bacterium]|nr:MAG: hypothetical protein A2X45_08175 [Lentisphaerae bacterium GWF2_50_93]HCE43748.1 DeoR family transcriptional regulator [Lentisphaeria bacterium]